MKRINLAALLLFMVFTNLSHGFFDPTAGRWISRDPIGERGGVNLNAFLENAGVTRIDHLGLHELGDDQKPNHAQPDCKCSITIDVAHGGMRESGSTQRAASRIENANGCHRYASVGCGSNKLNERYNKANIGVPQSPGVVIPVNNAETSNSDALETEGFNRRDICPANELIPNVDKAIEAAKAYAPTLCAACKCKEVTLRVNCSGAKDHPAEILEYEAHYEKTAQRKPVCNTDITIPCK